MDLAKYCVNAVLVEGRSVRAVAAATGRSKSWVQRHVSLYREGGEEALVPLRRGPKVPANLTSAVLEDQIVALAQASGRRRPRRRGPDHRVAPGARRGPGALALDHPPGAAPPWLRHPPAPKATPLELDPLRVRSAQRDLAVRYDALASRKMANRSRSSTSSTTTRVRCCRAWRCPSPRPPEVVRVFYETAAL